MIKENGFETLKGILGKNGVESSKVLSDKISDFKKLGSSAFAIRRRACG